MTFRFYTLFLFLSSCCLLSNCNSASPSGAVVDQEVVSPTTANLPKLELAATAFLAALDEDQKKKVSYPFADAERKNWHFVPKVRGGLPLLEMNEEQQQLAIDLLHTLLSEQGQKKVAGIMQLERVLQELENRPYENDYRNPSLYYVAIFGEPHEKDPWGWRWEGHHLSLNFSSVDRQLAVTPAFWGSNPGIVKSGDQAGTQVLEAEQNLGRELVKMLTADQAKKAVVEAPVPNEIVTLVQQKVELDEFIGLPVSNMNGQQMAKLEELLGAYLNNMQADIAQIQWQKLKESGIDKLYFAWIGETTPGAPHYYRIHGPTTLIEFDNVQNGANHIHAVWRDLTEDFGEDLLRQHYAHGHQH